MYKRKELLLSATEKLSHAKQNKVKNRTTTQKDKKKNTKKKTTAGTKSSHIKAIQWYRDLNREMVSGRQSSAA